MRDSYAEAIRASHRLPDGFAIHGHAIASSDDAIAGPDGLTPPQLRNEADWQRFQTALDQAAVCVLGRLGHEANPNTAGRRRLVLTRQVADISEDSGCWLWNPAGMSFGDALAHVVPEGAASDGSVIAVPGGQPVFDFFLAVGYDAFHLARAESVEIRAGTALFSGLGPDRSAVDVLAGFGLVAGPIEMLDAKAPVTLTVWRNGSA